MKGLYPAWLRMIKGMTGLRYELLTLEFQDEPGVFEAAARGSIRPTRQVPEAVVKELSRCANAAGLESVRAALVSKNMRAVAKSDPEYPALLKNIQDPPPVLFVLGRGRLSDLDRAIAIVGSRNCTDYGRQMANRFGHQLAERDVTVVSGLAMGVDRAAHEGALLAADAALPTVAVLAGGADVPYPMENYHLYKRILERGLILSEMPPGERVNPRTIPLRNRIIAGLCQGTLVAQAKRKSGTWHTINYALENGRDVFVLPGMADDPSCEGSNLMIKQGAFMTTEVGDILSYYDGWNVKRTPKKSQNTAIPQEAAPIIAMLKEADRTADELAEGTGIPMNRLFSLLTNLTRQGIIERKSYMQYHYIKEE